MSDDRRPGPAPGSRPPRGEPSDAPPKEFDQAFRRLWALAYRAAYQRFGDRQLAEDATSEAMAAAYDNWWMLRRRSMAQVEAWVRTVGERRAIDLVRAEHRHRVGPLPEGFDVADAAAEAELARVEDRELLERIMAPLSRRQRLVWILRYGSRLSYREIGDRLSMAATSVKTHLARARALLGRVTERRPRRPT